MITVIVCRIKDVSCAFSLVSAGLKKTKRESTQCVVTHRVCSPQCGIWQNPAPSCNVLQWPADLFKHFHFSLTCLLKGAVRKHPTPLPASHDHFFFLLEFCLRKKNHKPPSLWQKKNRWQVRQELSDVCVAELKINCYKRYLNPEACFTTWVLDDTKYPCADVAFMSIQAVWITFTTKDGNRFVSGVISRRAVCPLQTNGRT